MSTLIQGQHPPASAILPPGLDAGEENEKKGKTKNFRPRAVSKALSNIKRAGSVFGGGRSAASSSNAGSLPFDGPYVTPTMQGNGVSWTPPAGVVPPSVHSPPAISHTTLSDHPSEQDLDQMQMAYANESSMMQVVSGYPPSSDRHNADDEECPSRRPSFVGSDNVSESKNTNKKGSGQQISVTHDYHDFSGITDEEALRDVVERKNTGGVTTPFPEKLHELLSFKSARDVIDWAPHGRCFIIKKPKVFAATLMPLNFKHGKFTSFQRQLNLYGFKRITRGKDRGAYYHELFLRGRPKLCMKMRRMKIKGNGQKPLPDPENEPDFYSMTVMDDPPPPVRVEDKKETSNEPTKVQEFGRIKNVDVKDLKERDAAEKLKTRGAGPMIIIEPAMTSKKLKTPKTPVPLQVSVPMRDPAAPVQQDCQSRDKLSELMEIQRRDLERRYQEYQLQQQNHMQHHHDLQQNQMRHHQPQNHHLQQPQLHHQQPLVGPSGIVPTPMIANPHRSETKPISVNSHWNTNPAFGAGQMSDSIVVGTLPPAREDAPMSCDNVGQVNVTANAANGGGVTDMEIDESSSQDQLPPPSYEEAMTLHHTPLRMLSELPKTSEISENNANLYPSVGPSTRVQSGRELPKTTEISEDNADLYPSVGPPTRVHSGCAHSIGSDSSPHTSGHKSIRSGNSFSSSTTGSKGRGIRHIKQQGLFLRRSCSSNGSDSWIDEEQKQALEANIDFDNIFDQS